MSPHCDFDLEDGDQSLSMTLWPMIMNHHTKFGYRRLSSSEHIVRMNIYCHFEPSLWPWSWMQRSIFFTGHSDLWWLTIKQRWAARGSTVQKHNGNRFWSLSPRRDRDLEEIKSTFLYDSPAYDNTPYQVCLWKLQRFRRHRPDKIRTHRQTHGNPGIEHGNSDSSISP